MQGDGQDVGAGLSLGIFDHTKCHANYDDNYRDLQLDHVSNNKEHGIGYVCVVSSGVVLCNYCHNLEGGCSRHSTKGLIQTAKQYN